MKSLFIKLFLCCLMFCATTVFAQELKITGIVVDSENMGLPGVNVALKDGTTGTITDIDGNFTIKVPSRKSILIFSFIGYAQQEVSVGDKNSLRIKLVEDSKMIDEVVIVGFGTQKKENLTGAVKSVDVKVLDARPITNVVSGLQGAVAGLSITNDNGGAPGQKMNINIRGTGTVGTSSKGDPLVLIDGIEGDLSLVNPNDIENISVLKDAAAASIYGSRAPFGVLLVTTKKGKKGLAVTYSGNIRMQNPLNTPHMVDSYTHALVSNDANLNAGGGALFGQGMLDKILAYQQGQKMYDKDGNDKHIEWGTGPRGETIMDDWEWESGTWANTNWYDVYLKKISYSQEHNVNLSGGNDKLTYYVSGRYYQQNGLYNYMKDEYNTLSVNGNFNFTINDKISFAWNTRLTSETTDKPSAMNDLFFRNLSKLFPTTPLTMPNGDYNAYSFVPALRDGGQQVSNNQLFYNQFKLTIEPVKDWKIYVDFSNRIETPTYTRQIKQLQEVLPNGEERYIPVFKGLSSGDYKVKDGGFDIQPAAGDRWYEEQNTHITYYNANARTDYEKKFGKHYFKVLLGTQLEYYKTNKVAVGSTGVILDDTPFLPSTSGESNLIGYNSKGDWATLGIFARINYSWNDRYLLEANFRTDAASRFPSNQRWGYFPSFSAGWNIAQENFFENLRDKGFDMLKLRASYGSLGNQNTKNIYPYFEHVETGTPSYTFDGSQIGSILAPKPFSTSITWETVKTIDLGLDIALLSNRLSASFDWYQRTTEEMVGPAKALPNVFGADVPDTNNAEFRTTGWELEIAWRDRINSDWSYEISASVSDYTEKILKYDSADKPLKEGKFFTGKHFGDIYGYRVHGIAKNDDEMNEWIAARHDQSAFSKVWGGGDFMYEDLNNDGKIDNGSNTWDNRGDLDVIGNSTPRYQYGFRGSLVWKFIDFSMFWQGIGKRDLYFTASNFDGIGDAYDRPIAEEHMDYFRYADNYFGENLDAYYARPRTDAANNQVNDYYLQNGAYLRLKNVTIGYTLPQNLRVSKIIKKLRVYVSGENLLTFSPLRIYDPEAIGLSSATWGPGMTYPMFRTYSIGLSATF